MDSVLENYCLALNLGFSELFAFAVVFFCIENVIISRLTVLAKLVRVDPSYWNDRRSRRVFLCFYSAIFQLTSAKFQTFAYNSRTVGSSYMKF